MNSPKEYKFGIFRLDVNNKTLSDGTRETSIAGKRFEILLLLVEKAGRVVRKEEIKERVWPGQEVDETNLTQQIFYVRRLLGDDPTNPSFILTVPGVGYIFYQSVQVVSANGSTDVVRMLPVKLEGDDAIQSVSGVDARQRALANGLKRRHVLVIAWVAIFCLLSVGFAFWWRSTFDVRVSPDPTVEPLVTMRGLKVELSFSRDGRQLAFTSEGETVDSQNIFVKAIDSDHLIRLTRNSNNDHSPAWSPDNRRIAFLREGKRANRKNELIVIPAVGGDETVVGEGWLGLDWSPDGEHIAFCDSDNSNESTGVYLINLANRERRRVTGFNSQSDQYDSDPKFSLDGRSIAFVRWTSSYNGDIHLLELATGKVRRLTTDQSRVRSIQWSPSGYEILYVSDRVTKNFRIWKIPLAGGQPQRVSGQLSEVSNIAVSPTGIDGQPSLAYTEYMSDTNILIEDISGNKAQSGQTTHCTINSTQADHSPQFSPDGTKIVFISDRSGFEELWLADKDCSNIRQITTLKEKGIGSPRWSPDGRSIAFDRYVERQSEVFIIEIESGRLQRLTDRPHSDFLPAWSQDGREIFFCSELRSNVAREIWRVPVFGGQPTLVTRNKGFESWATDDGTALLYSSYNTIYRLDLSRNFEQRILNLENVAFNRYWTLRGDGIYHLVRDLGGVSRVERFDLKTRTSRTVLSVSGVPDRYLPGLSISPDGRQIAISLIINPSNNISLIKGWN